MSDSPAAVLFDATGSEQKGQKVMAGSIPVVLASDQSPLPVSVSSGIDRTATGPITAAQNVFINTQASGACGVQITGVWTGTLLFEATVDGATWKAVNGVVPDTGVEQSSTTANGLWVIACAGFNQVRVRGNTVTAGTATIFLESSSATQAVILGDPLPTGANVIGAVTQSGGPWTQNLTQVGGSALALGQTVMASSVPVTIASNQSAVPVSAASLPLPTGAATAANQATEIASLANLDVALSTRLKPADTLAAVTTVTTVTAVTAITNALPAGGNTIGKVDQGAGGASAWLVTGAGGTFPITAASLPLPTGAATEATLATRLADATFTARINTQGQKTMALSTPVVIASDQSAVPVSIAATVTVAGAKSNNGGVPGATNLGVLPVVATAAAPTYTEGNQAALSTDLAGNLRVSATIAANSSVNVAQIAGTTTAVNNGTANAGTQRVTIASDSTGQVTLATGANTIGALTANQSVNNAQISGTAMSVNNGVVGAGVQRVTIASDSTGQVTLATGANTIGALTANQSVNLNQVGGTSVVTGGVAGTQGVGGLAASGAAKAGNPNQIGGVFNTTQPTVTTGQAVEAQMTARGAQIVATGVDALNVTAAASTNDIGKVRFSLPTTDAMSEAIINFAGTGNNTIVAGVAAQTVRVYRMFFVVSGATTIQIRDGASTGLTGVMTFTAGGSFFLDLQAEPWFTTSSANAFVINQTGTAQISGRIYYTQS